MSSTTNAGRRRIPMTDELLAKLAFRQQFLALADDDFCFAEETGGNPPTQRHSLSQHQPT